MRLAVIGLGAIAPYFLDAIDADPVCSLAAVCDNDPRKLAPWANSEVRTFGRHEELLGAGVADGVIITLPNHLHAPVAGAALKRRVHVCCEKPLTLSTAAAEGLVATARESRRVLFTAFHRRYNRHVQRLAEEVAAAGAGVVAVRAHYFENILEHTGGDRWYLDLDRCGGGCVVDNGPNALDAVRHVVGPLRLEDATIGDIRSGVEFCADLRLRTRGGAPVRVELDWALPTGEHKHIAVDLDDGRTLTADMLEGYGEFKSSLRHEYSAIVADFRLAVAASGAHRDDGATTVALVEAAYSIAKRKEQRTRMTTKAPLGATLVKLLFHSSENRGMRLAPWRSRCVRAGDVHEIVLTTDEPEHADGRIDRVGFLGFAAFAASGVLERGDEVMLGDRRLGTVCGFDECHAPNHLNVLVHADGLHTAGDLDAAVGDDLRFQEAS
jgi:L-arabinose 1-dehydrogenase